MCWWSCSFYRNEKYSIHISSINGGNRTNAIPREASTIFYIEKNKSSEILEFIDELFREIKLILNGIEPNLELTIEKLENYSNVKVLSKKIQNNLADPVYTAIPATYGKARC